jgi:tetratricopeptide (TPR) repeat protein
LLGTFRTMPEPEQGYSALAEVNRSASARDATVSPACFTAHVTPLGENGGTVHDWPPDREYLPPFVDVHGMFLPRLRPAVDEHGRAKPIQLRGMSGASFEASAEYFRVALEEKPTDPSVLTNYGNWLKDRGELTEAEAAYRSSIASDDAFANAHGNLAILLDDRDELDDAEAEYRRAVELDSRSPIYTANLAFFLWRRRKAPLLGAALLRDALGRERSAFTVGRFAHFSLPRLAERVIPTPRLLPSPSFAVALNNELVRRRGVAALRRRASTLGRVERLASVRRLLARRGSLLSRPRSGLTSGDPLAGCR